MKAFAFIVSITLIKPANVVSNAYTIVGLSRNITINKIIIDIITNPLL